MTATYAQRKALGDYGERLAARFLVNAGFVILDRNWRCSQGELDIVAAENALLVACEVKTRSSARFGTPFEAITPAKAGRLQRLARLWAHEHEFQYSEARVDVVTVVRGVRGAGTVEHIIGVA